MSALVERAIGRINGLTGLPSLYPELVGDAYSQMAIAALPDSIDLTVMKKRLIEEFRVEIPLIRWKDKQFIRISIQGYNDENDVDALLAALEVVLAGEAVGV